MVSFPTREDIYQVGADFRITIKPAFENENDALNALIIINQDKNPYEFYNCMQSIIKSAYKTFKISFDPDFPIQNEIFPETSLLVRPPLSESPSITLICHLPFK